MKMWALWFYTFHTTRIFQSTFLRQKVFLLGNLKYSITKAVQTLFILINMQGLPALQPKSKSLSSLQHGPREVRLKRHCFLPTSASTSRSLQNFSSYLSLSVVICFLYAREYDYKVRNIKKRKENGWMDYKNKTSIQINREKLTFQKARDLFNIFPMA